MSVIIGEFTPEQMRAWAAKMVNRKHHRPYGRRPNIQEVHEMKWQVLERDGNDAVCYWCQKPFLKTPSGRISFRDATLEHIVPLYLGGKHVLHNCAFAHRPCNR